MRCIRAFAHNGKHQCIRCQRKYSKKKMNEKINEILNNSGVGIPTEKKKKPKSKYDFPTLVTSTSLPTILVHILLELERLANTLEAMQQQRGALL